MTSMKQKMITTLAAVTVGAGMLAASAPAQAGYKYHHGHGGVIAAGVIGGLALGAMAAGAAYAAPAPVYYAPACYRSLEPVTDVYGRVLYYRKVRVCH